MTQIYDQATAIAAFRPGVYRHYKGSEYLALSLARADETEEIVVVYSRLYPRAGLPLSTRKLEIWSQSVLVDGALKARFTYLGPQSLEPLP